MSLTGQIALVTGASRGIGKAVLMALAQAGAYVIGTEINEEGAALITSELQKANNKGHGIVLDVTQKEAVKKALEEIKLNQGAISILVNNAGIRRDNLLLRMKEEEWGAVIETNLTSVFRLTQLCLSDMVKARYGRIVNMSSVVGVVGNAGQANYAAAKAGLLGFTKSLAQEIASRDITVNAVAPGFVDTPMTQSLTDKQKEAILDRVPIKRLATPEEIANVVLFLVSKEAGYITGQTIHINGGMFMV